MARIHARVKGKSGSTKPAVADLSFVKLKKEEIVKLILKMAKEDVSLSKIGLKLRDTYGIPSVKKVVGKSISQILEENNVLPEIPEDLNSLIVRAKALKKHLEHHKKDVHNKRGLILLESKIRRLTKYYKKNGRLPENWRSK